MERNSWYLVSSHGSLVFFIAAHPHCTIADIVDGLSLARRTVWGLIGDLRRAGMLSVRRQGRHHQYSVNPEAPFRHPTIDGLRLGMVLGGVSPSAGPRSWQSGSWRRRARQARGAASSP